MREFHLGKYSFIIESQIMVENHQKKIGASQELVVFSMIACAELEVIGEINPKSLAKTHLAYGHVMDEIRFAIEMKPLVSIANPILEIDVPKRF
jgi:hypothetical protein